VKPKWNVSNANPAPGVMLFDLSDADVLEFEGTGIGTLSDRVYKNGTEWGCNCLYSSEIVGMVTVETVTGSLKATHQPFTISRTIGELRHSGAVFSEEKSSPGPYSTSGSGSWTAEEGG
jgi:hypothetical protein